MIRLLAFIVTGAALLGTGCLGKCDPKKEVCRETGGSMDGGADRAPDATEDTPAQPDTSEPTCIEDGICDCLEDPTICAGDCLGCADDGMCDAAEDCSCVDCADLCNAC